MVESILSTEMTSVTAAAQMLLDQMCYLEEVGWFQAFLDILLASGELSNLRRAHECLEIMADAEDVCVFMYRRVHRAARRHKRVELPGVRAAERTQEISREDRTVHHQTLEAQ